MCPFCQNWELIISSDKFPVIEWEHIEEKLRTKKGWVDGVVLTGGEPLCKEQEVVDLCQKIKKLALLIKIDTNGAFPEVMQKLIEDNLIDYVAMDIKAPLDERYNIATGKQIDLKKIEQSIHMLMNGSTDYEFRTTCVPGIIDVNAIHQIGKAIKGAEKWALQAHVPDNAYKSLYRQKLDPKYHKQLREYSRIASEYVKNTILRSRI